MELSVKGFRGVCDESPEWKAQFESILNGVLDCAVINIACKIKRKEGAEQKQIDSRHEETSSELRQIKAKIGILLDGVEAKRGIRFPRFSIGDFLDYSEATYS